jgi:hypothetical protein
MNPYYSHESEVGPVYDVADYSRFKPIVTAITALMFAACAGFFAIYFWNPDLITENPSEMFVDAHEDAKNMMKEHPIGTKVGVGLSGMFSGLCLAMAISCMCNSISGRYHIRVGEGGISLRVPDGLTTVLEKDIPWSEISQLKVIQEKRVGALSRNAGNTGGEIEVHLYDGTSHDIRLEHFKQDAWLIHQRIDEVKDMRSSSIDEDDTNWQVDNDQSFTLQEVR